jgi:hypothetical protein
MKNKKLLLSSLFLSLPVVTQCMEGNNSKLIIPQQKISIHGLQEKRNEFKKKLDNNKEFWKFGLSGTGGFGQVPDDYFLSCTYHQDFHKKTYGEISNETKFYQDYNVRCFSWYNIRGLQYIGDQYLRMVKKVRINNYSALGSATMAEKVTFQEKQEFIQKLLALGFNPTPEDKELAIVEQWERCDALLIIKTCILLKSPLLLEMSVPQEIMQYISLLMWETEESLL